MVLTEFDEEKFEAMIREEEREEGRREGREEGHREGLREGILALSKLVSDGLISLEEAASSIGMTEAEFQSAIQPLKILSDK